MDINSPNGELRDYVLNVSSQFKNPFHAYVKFLNDFPKWGLSDDSFLKLAIETLSQDKKYIENDFCTENSDLPIYAETPKPVCDIPCEYDYFHVFDYGESAFYNNRDNAYLHVGSKNTVMRFEEILIDDSIRLWGKKNNTLYLGLSFTTPTTEL